MHNEKAGQAKSAVYIECQLGKGRPVYKSHKWILQVNGQAECFLTISLQV